MPVEEQGEHGDVPHGLAAGHHGGGLPPQRARPARHGGNRGILARQTRATQHASVATAYQSIVAAGNAISAQFLEHPENLQTLRDPELKLEHWDFEEQMALRPRVAVFAIQQLDYFELVVATMGAFPPSLLGRVARLRTLRVRALTLCAAGAARHGLVHRGPARPGRDTWIAAGRSAGRVQRLPQHSAVPAEHLPGQPSRSAVTEAGTSQQAVRRAGSPRKRPQGCSFVLVVSVRATETADTERVRTREGH